MRNDLAELTALNRDYINSVQNSDVKRFDEILAEDFYCSNPDKSLVDRSAFLKQTAVPVTIKNLRGGRREDSRAGRFRDYPCGAPAIRRRTVNRPPAATRIAGRGRTAAGSRCRRMCRGKDEGQSSEIVMAGLVPAIHVLLHRK